jgi:hypothetical protein
MKYYIVKLLLRIGGYEKHTYHLLEGENVLCRDLEEGAFTLESHNDDAGYREDGYWWDDDMIYELSDIKLISKEDAEKWKELHQ